jgi:hypothetical protein
MSERWVPVVGFEGRYEVSDLGRVRSLDRKIKCPTGRYGPRVVFRKGVIISDVRASKGYRQVKMTKNGEGTTRKVHVLVAAAFIGPRPEGHHVCHIDGDKTNNRPSNLYYGTPKENKADCLARGTHAHGSRVWRAKLNDDAIRQIRAMAASMTQTAIAPLFGVDSSVICRIVNGKSWRYVA